MRWLDADFKAGLRDARLSLRWRTWTLVDIAIATGAGMYRQPETKTRYLRSGSIGFTPIADRREDRPGGFHEEGQLTLTVRASDSGASGPSNRSIILRTGSNFSREAEIEGQRYKFSRVTECKVTDELVCEIDLIQPK